ncbi:MAG: penicillin-binding protein, partial [Merismopedia sp. SIO2A8]|nr:penicillin-binding protein [Merismopedia sp. SIO2A8]
ELQGTIAPYFYDHVFSELKTLLGSELARDGNFIIESTLNPDMQAQAEASLVQHISTSGASFGFSQGAMVTINAQTGDIIAMVGGADYQKSQFNRATQALRQPGSTFKIFPYALALEQGVSPNTTYACTTLNWAGQAFPGCRSGTARIDMYRGMAQSENVIALRIAQAVGLNQVVQLAHQMGIASKLQPVPGLVLGQSEVTVLELTGAFSVLANDGILKPPHTINRILDSSDCDNLNDRNTCRVIYDAHTNPQHAAKQVITTRVAARMTQLLQGVIASGTGGNAFIGQGEAGKTGTTNKNVDLWFVGYLPEQKIVTGIWLGNDDNTPSRGSSAQAAQLWGNYMTRSSFP